MIEHWSVLGVAPPRSAWFTEVARWATSGALPIDFVKCVSAAEARARLGGGRVFSALLIDADTPGSDRDLVDQARAAGAVTVIVGDGGSRHRWHDMGAVDSLDDDFDPGQLLALLVQHARPLAELQPAITAEPEPPPARWRGRLVAVTGSGGTGTSVTAMGLGQEFAHDHSNRGLVLLADLALRADLGMLHDARAVIPGVPELVEGHRSGRLAPAELRALTWAMPDRGYHLLLGVRRPRDWTALRPRAFGAALEGLLSTFRVVVADVDPEVDGQSETGSLDLEDHNAMARTTLPRADVLVVTADPDTKGIHRLVDVLRDLVEFGVEPTRTVVAFTRAPRSRARRAEATRGLGELLADPRFNGISNPVFVPRRADLEDTIRDGRPVPRPVGRVLHREIASRLAAASSPAPLREPMPVDPGTVGTWTERSA